MKPRLLQFVVSSYGAEDAANVEQWLRFVLPANFSIVKAYDTVPCFVRNRDGLITDRRKGGGLFAARQIPVYVTLPVGTQWNPMTLHHEVLATGYHLKERTPLKARIPVIWNGRRRCRIGWADCQDTSVLKSEPSEPYYGVMLHLGTSKMAREALRCAKRVAPRPGLVTPVIEDTIAVAVSLNTQAD